MIPTSYQCSTCGTLSKVNSFDGNVNKSSFAADQCNNSLSLSTKWNLVASTQCGAKLHQFSIKPFKQPHSFTRALLNDLGFPVFKKYVRCRLIGVYEGSTELSIAVQGQLRRAWIKFYLGIIFAMSLEESSVCVCLSVFPSVCRLSLATPSLY